MKVVILGATGNIGQQALNVLDKLKMQLVGFSFNNNIELAKQIIKKYKPNYYFCQKDLSSCKNYEELLKKSKPDIVLNAISGFAGLEATLIVLKLKIPLALANKESLVVAGHHVMKLAKKNKVAIFPVDSEHAAIKECILKDKEIEEILITASGGPFLNTSISKLNKVTIENALNHPTWKMGKKISIDSATMMNKVLEIIEAYWLFGTKNITPIIHQQSIVHSMVRYKDNSIIASLSVPDMQLAIQKGLTKFESTKQAVIKPLDFSNLNLSFKKVDVKKFLAIKLANLCLKNPNSTLPVVINALNEVAIEKFLSNEIKFTEIVKFITKNLKLFVIKKNPNLFEIYNIDKRVRGKFCKH